MKFYLWFHVAFGVLSIISTLRGLCEKDLKPSDRSTKAIVAGIWMVLLFWPLFLLFS